MRADLLGEPPVTGGRIRRHLPSTSAGLVFNFFSPQRVSSAVAPTSLGAPARNPTTRTHVRLLGPCFKTGRTRARLGLSSPTGSGYGAIGRRRTAPVTRHGRRPARAASTRTDARKIPSADSARPTQEKRIQTACVRNYRRDSGQRVRGSAPLGALPSRGLVSAELHSDRVDRFPASRDVPLRRGKSVRPGGLSPDGRRGARENRRPARERRRRPRDQRKQRPSRVRGSDTKLSPRRRVHRVSFVYPRTVSRTR